MRQTLVTCLVLLLGGLWSGCSSDAAPGRDQVAEVIRRADHGLSRKQARGRAIFATHCTICHGETGLGDGFNASRLAAKPPPMRYIITRYRGKELRRAVERGSASLGRSSLCPPWGQTLQPHGIEAVLSYLPELLPARPTTP